MALAFDGGTGRWVPPLAWLTRLQAVWDDQRADAALPDADELFLADLADLLPRLLLASRDPGDGGLRVEFAGAAARILLAVDPVGPLPEAMPEDDPLAWVADGLRRVCRPAVPGPHWARADDRLGLFLPYGGFDGRVTLVLAGLARWPAPADGGDRVVRLRPGSG